MNYREIIFQLKNFDEYSAILVALLSSLGFDSFQEEDPLLKAYIEEEGYDPEFLDQLSEVEQEFVLISNEPMEKINWNEEWEKNFPPLSVDDFCYIRAPFHPKVSGYQFELVIEPKMSFGTGHHATTQNMIQLMRDQKDVKTVLDVGSGTGILAILAAKMGAQELFATDIEDWAFENMKENFERNDTNQIVALLGDLPLKELEGRQFDLLLANINKNVLLTHIPHYKQLLNAGGRLLLSGFYKFDLDDINEACTMVGLKMQRSVEKNKWIAAEYLSI